MRLIEAAAVFLLVLLPVAPAQAHDIEPGADLRVTQTFSAGEVTLVVAGVSQVPAPLPVSAHAMRPMRLELELRSMTDGSSSTGVVDTGRAPAVLRIQHEGPHELRIRSGDEVSLVPFRLVVPESSGATMVTDGAFLVAGLLLVGSVLAGRGSRILAGGSVAAAAVAVTVTLLAPYLSPAGSSGEPERGRPYAQARFSTTPAVTGAEFTLTMRLSDGATGRPVDDLAVDHEAMAHVVVTSADGAVFRHLHPLRIAPGVLTVGLTLPRPGRYLAYLEIERQQSGGQLLSGTFDVSGTVRQDTADHSPSDRNIIVPRLFPGEPRAGSPVTIEIGTEGPHRPWLGMPGHLVVRSSDGAHLAHVHATAAGAALLRFTFALPEPGHYLAWVQYIVGDRLMTEPFTVEVGR
ncbi:hypothetical protein IU459_31165 [Nocardia amamiensis]|uniref:Secreted protein n=1 Tax=Nocardia amamiensis TaxID=404578 RepID=A0ABS0CZG3_9NOCA|nr:hypothetical protein [Nocardia amamiensis]MBF6301974.1 hypothetical protein [Nocardia amamiensis]